MSFDIGFLEYEWLILGWTQKRDIKSNNNRTFLDQFLMRPTIIIKKLQNGVFLSVVVEAVTIQIEGIYKIISDLLYLMFI